MSPTEGCDDRESEDAGDVADLIIRAADALVFAGPGARATVRFAIDEQWFAASLVMIDEGETSPSPGDQGKAR